MEVEKRSVNPRVIILLSTIAFFLVLNTVTSYYFGLPVSFASITGKGTSGTLNLTIEGSNGTITIDSPLNQTYNFNIGDTYNVSLNVSADVTITQWNYSLFDARHNTYTQTTINFTPNITIFPSRWSNVLSVTALTGSTLLRKNVTFEIEVPNSAPLIGAVDDPILACEGSTLSHFFNVTDVDEDNLTGTFSSNPFFLSSQSIVNDTTRAFQLFSGILPKSTVGTYLRNISITDPGLLTDTRETTIEVIEINNEPTLTGLGAQTVFLNGSNSTFYHQMALSDIEDGNASSGNFSFNLTFTPAVDLFTISSLGVMNYTPDISEVGVYSLEVCAVDQALSSPHANVSLCTGSGLNNTVCDTFSLTVTEFNRAPTIDDYSPLDLAFSSGGNTAINFEVNVSDLDGTIPDIDWYVEGILVEHNENESSDDFSYTPGCGFSGSRVVNITTTDGESSNSVQWNVTVDFAVCPPAGGGNPVSSGGGGGGGGGGDSSGAFCFEDWVCGQGFGACQSLEDVFQGGTLLVDEYLALKETCSQNQFLGDSCGFQTEICGDLNYCNNTVIRTEVFLEKRACKFTVDPSCFDEIKNCHGEEGLCELLVDCGGPCAACPTCSDGIRNQQEFGIDCGGPCSKTCEFETPQEKRDYFWLWLLLLFLVIIGFIAYKIRKILGYSPLDEEREKRLQKKVNRKIHSKKSSYI